MHAFLWDWSQTHYGLKNYARYHCTTAPSVCCSSVCACFSANRFFLALRAAASHTEGSLVSQYTPTSSTKPKVNVAAFLKQREQSKMSGVDSRLSPSTPMTTFLANRGDQGRDDQNIETQSLTPQMRSRGYASNSQKGGQVGEMWTIFLFYFAAVNW